MRLLSYFLTGATATTLMGWGLALTPFFLRVLIYAVAFVLIAIVSLLAFDDPVSQHFDIELQDYYCIVWGVAITFIAGLAVLGGILWE